MLGKLKDKLLWRQPIDKHAGEYYKHDVEKKENPDLLTALDDCLKDASKEDSADV